VFWDTAGDGGATYLDGAEVDEEVGGAVLGGDEAVSLLVVEPLDGAVLAVGGGGGVHFDVRCVGGCLVGEGVVWCGKWVLMSRVLGEGTEELNLAWPAFLCLCGGWNCIAG
jgi:hypothetical protein